MKTRRGFVSNSSTSSFMIVGINLSDESVSELFGMSEEEFEKKYDGDYYEFFEEILKGTGLEGQSFYEGEEYYVGVSITSSDECAIDPEKYIKEITEAVNKANIEIPKLKEKYKIKKNFKIKVYGGVSGQ